MFFLLGLLFAYIIVPVDPPDNENETSDERMRDVKELTNQRRVMDGRLMTPNVTGIDEGTEKDTNLADLCDDVLFIVFSYLNYTDRSRVKQVNRKLAEIHNRATKVQPSLLDLPTSALKLIIGQFEWWERIRFSQVCRRFARVTRMAGKSLLQDGFIWTLVIIVFEVDSVEISWDFYDRETEETERQYKKRLPLARAVRKLQEVAATFKVSEISLLIKVVEVPSDIVDVLFHFDVGRFGVSWESHSVPFPLKNLIELARRVPRLNAIEAATYDDSMDPEDLATLYKEMRGHFMCFLTIDLAVNWKIMQKFAELTMGINDPEHFSRDECIEGLKTTIEGGQLWTGATGYRPTSLHFVKDEKIISIIVNEDGEYEVETTEYDSRIEGPESAVYMKGAILLPQ